MTAPRVSILTSGHDVADARLHRQVAALRRAGAQVEVLGLGYPGRGPEGAVVRTWVRGGLGRRFLRALTMPLRARGDVLVTLDPDVALGARLWWLLGRRRQLVADVHEDYRLLLRDRGWARGLVGLAARAVEAGATGASRRAHLTVVADEQLLVDAPRRLVLRNLPDPQMLPAAAEPDAEPRALYVGDLRASRGLFAMLEAVRDAPGWTIDLVGPMDAQTRAAYHRVVDEDPALASRVRWHGRMVPRRAWTLGAGAWVGLLLLDDTPAFRTAMPSKLYEYLCCGLPVLTTDLPRPVQLVQDTGAGVVVGSAQRAAEVLRHWVDEPDAYAALRAKAAASGSAFSGIEELDRFAAAVLGLVGPRRPD